MDLVDSILLQFLFVWWVLGVRVMYDARKQFRSVDDYVCVLFFAYDCYLHNIVIVIVHNRIYPLSDIYIYICSSCV